MDNFGVDEEYSDPDTMAEYIEPSTISEFQETHQDLINEIEYEISRAEERLITQMEEFVAGIWEAIQDSDETVEIINNTFVRRINDEIVEEGYLYTFVDFGDTIFLDPEHPGYEFTADGRLFFGIRGELESAIATEQENLLSLILENTREINLENFNGVASFAFIITDDSNQTFDINGIERMSGVPIDIPIIEIRFDGSEPAGISFNSRSFRRIR